MNQTTEETICQSCGMPLAAVEHFGTNSDNSLSEDYCCFCFQHGSFTHNRSLDETIVQNLSFLDESEKADGRTVTKEEAELKMRVQLPVLKRWQSHQNTHMEYYKAVNRSIDYINENLNKPINLYDLAEIVHISGFHFHRIFKAIIGEGPGEYIQRLRLEKAMFKLQTTQLTIYDIAEQTGYQSLHALSKAFKKRFGVSPSRFRLHPSELSVSIEPIANMPLNPEIKKIESKEVIYTRIIDPFKQTDAFIKAWKKLIQFMDVSGIPDEKYEYLSLSRDVSTITRPEHYRIYACISNYRKLKPKGSFGIQTIESGLYAVFTYAGSYKNLQALYCNIYRYWIPNSNYELRDLPFFEKYLNSPDTVAADQLLTEVYIPVTPLT